MTSPDGETTTDRQSIADVCATFYEDLYRRQGHNNLHTNTDEHDTQQRQHNKYTPHSQPKNSLSKQMLKHASIMFKTRMLSTWACEPSKPTTKKVF